MDACLLFSRRGLSIHKCNILEYLYDCNVILNMFSWKIPFMGNQTNLKINNLKMNVNKMNSELMQKFLSYLVLVLK